MEDQAEKLRRLVLQSSFTEATNRPFPATISIIGGSADSGSSAFTTNLGSALARKGRRVVLAHLEHLPKRATACGVMGVFALERQRLLDVHQHRAESSVHHALLSERIPQYSHCIDLVIIDAGVVQPNFPELCRTPRDMMVFVTTSDHEAIMQTYAGIKQLISPAGVNSTKIGVLVNRVTDGRQAAATFERLTQTCQRFLAVELTNLGELPEGTWIHDDLQALLPTVLRMPTSVLARSIDRIAAMIDQHVKAN